MGFLMAIYFVTMFMALTMTQPVATSAVYTLVPLMTAATAFFIVGQKSGAGADQSRSGRPRRNLGDLPRRPSGIARLRHHRAN
jgi:hypothetical protein